MCGVAGVLLKNKDNAGEKIIDMLEAIKHRGPDSTGLAVFDMDQDTLKVVVGCPNEKRLFQVINQLTKQKISFDSAEKRPNFFRLTVYPQEIEQVLDTVRSVPGCSIYSYGRYVTIVKDTFLPAALLHEYGVNALSGSFAIGHVRLATESRVNPFWSHPFQSLAMPDLCIVHNGQITNFFKKKRLLEKRGYQFQTDNDSEVIAQEIAYCMQEEKMSFEEALREVANGLDGAFSLIAAAPGKIGVAKDKLATKPLMFAETDEAVALASEEIAIEKILGPKIDAEELPPGEVFVWGI